MTFAIKIHFCGFPLVILTLTHTASESISPLDIMALTQQILLVIIGVAFVYSAPLTPGLLSNVLSSPLPVLNNKPLDILNKPLGIIGDKPVSGALSTLGLRTGQSADHAGLIPGLTSASGSLDNLGLNDLSEALGLNSGISSLQDPHLLSKPLNALGVLTSKGQKVPDAIGLEPKPGPVGGSSDEKPALGLIDHSDEYHTAER
ncbi:uncharacterized protein LOC114246312 [Bombyx mandarina]|uniref:Uncharacterized protein LOC114246312 n=1 Tax=Bombyx mandarina TaxID=7092 RepID=A0A6J2K2R6_BOMMA|nr:uncharacterized protein LOC114246312 [Bombyx mandarina]